MKALRSCLAIFVGLILVASFATGAKFAAAPPAPPKVSTFAPAPDLVAQVDYYKKRIEDAVASEADFDEAKQARIKKDASLIAILALHLGLHDSDNPLKKSAGGIVKAAQQLTNAADYQSAHSGYSNLEKALKGETKGEELKWGKVAALGQLMKQVSVINASMKRGLQSSRLKSQAKKTSGESATLAAIANALPFDTHEVKNETDLPSWYQYSAEFRDSAGALNAAIKTGETAKVGAALKRMSTSCETCHKKFHQQDLPAPVE